MPYTDHHQLQNDLGLLCKVGEDISQTRSIENLLRLRCYCSVVQLVLISPDYYDAEHLNVAAPRLWGLAACFIYSYV